MLVVGLLGYKQSGKSTAARCLVNKHRFVEVSWAWALKNVIGKQLFGLSDIQINGDDPVREAVIPEWGRSPREILQVVGTELFRDNFDPDFWVKLGSRQIEHHLRNGHNVVVSDCRFPNEIKCIKKEFDGTTVRIVRDGQTREDVHASETALDNYEADYKITAPSGGINQLQFMIDAIIKGLK